MRSVHVRNINAPSLSQGRHALFVKPLLSDAHGGIGHVAPLISGSIVHAADVYVAQTDSIVVAQRHNGLCHRRAHHIANDHIVNVPVAIRHRKLGRNLKACKAAQRNQIVPTLAKDVLNENVVAAHAQINAILVGNVVHGLERQIAQPAIARKN